MEPITDLKELVRRGYDQISHAYRGDSIPRDRGSLRYLKDQGLR